LDGELVIDEQQPEVANSDRVLRIAWMMWLPGECFGPLPEGDDRDYVAEWIGGNHAD
jgi:hypothetical protein